MAKKNVKVRDLKPNKDAKGGGGHREAGLGGQQHGQSGGSPRGGLSGGQQHGQSGGGSPRGAAN